MLIRKKCQFQCSFRHCIACLGHCSAILNKPCVVSFLLFSWYYMIAVALTNLTPLNRMGDQPKILQQLKTAFPVNLPIHAACRSSPVPKQVRRSEQSQSWGQCDRNGFRIAFGSLSDRFSSSKQIKPDQIKRSEHFSMPCYASRTTFGRHRQNVTA